jgi:hypothetical protein
LHALVPVLVAAGAAACDFEVTNPGPIQDESINNASAHQALVNATIRSFGDGLGFLYIGDGIVHGHLPSGHTGTAGTEELEEVALLNSERNGTNGSWTDLQRARWVGEETLRRIEEAGIDPNTYALAAQAHFWAGMASRTLGENMCTAVLDGGEPLPKSAFFDNAIAHFDAAEAIANATGQADLATASVGARAAANLFIGNNAAARADAATVPFDFEFTTQYTGFSGDPNYYLWEGVLSLAFQSMSLWGTPAHPHFLTTGDSRVAWGYDNGSLEIPAGEPYATRGQTHPSRPTWNALVPMYYPIKGYAPRKLTNSRELQIFEPDLADQRQLQVNLVTGREMELVLAELDLLAGDWPQAMTRINNVRTSTPVYQADLSTVMDLTLHPREQTDADEVGMPVYFNGTPGDFSGGGNLDPVSAASADEAWAALKFERYLELHLEMRRFGDRWRWRENGTPGTLHPLEYIDPMLTGKYGVPADQLNLCFPLTRDENDANDNVPDDYVDWNG